VVCAHAFFQKGVLIPMQDLLSFGFVEWSALFFVFVLSKFLQVTYPDHLGLGLLHITSAFSELGGWRGFFVSFYMGEFLVFLIYLAMMSLVATLVLLPHWLMCDYFGYPYRLQTEAIYTGAVWSFGHLANCTNKQIQALKEDVQLWKKMTIDYEKQIEKNIKETKK
jgi:hypothetical protein